jgi:vacuolar-type H+-ATPase subunit I/STV1
MRLEQKKDEELARRKGSTGRTIIQFIWLIISFAIAYFAVDYAIDAGYISYNMFYNVGIPREVPPIVIMLVLMLAIVVAMQLIMFIGYMIANPEGRRRTGNPSMKSGDQNPYDYRNG